MRKDHSDEPDKICVNCVNSERMGDSDVCICAIKGAVRADGHCRKYEFDLLKFDPGRPKMPTPQGIEDI